ncbi:sigma-70 family RNA polymerase sigma factor [Bacillus infantis]|uniref:sigma-70 family RNA polymerase sigma factor n=1 Tax=Bacillus infantis TaxID=324767 RepID=UPI003CE71563
MAKLSLDGLYEEYARDVLRYLLSLSADRATAEDMMQETFYRAYLHIEDLHEEKVRPWLFRVAQNAYIDHIRKRKKESITSDEFFTGLKDTGASMEHRVFQQEKLGEVIERMQRLPEPQKQALLLVTVHDFTYREASEILGVSESNTRLLVFRARKKLRDFERGEEDE